MVDKYKYLYYTIITVCKLLERDMSKRLSERADGTVTVDVDGQIYKISFDINSQTVDKIISCIKPACGLSKHLIKLFISESLRISRNKNIH